MYTVDNIDRKRIPSDKFDYNCYSKNELRQICIDLGLRIDCHTVKYYIVVITDALSPEYLDKSRFKAWLSGPDPYNICDDPKLPVVEDKKYGIIANTQKEIDVIIASISKIEIEIYKNKISGTSLYYSLDEFQTYNGPGTSWVNHYIRVRTQCVKATKRYKCTKLVDPIMSVFFKESDVQPLLEMYYRGTHFTLNDGREIDILTKTEIIEIKRWEKWRDAIFQVLQYTNSYYEMNGVKLQPVVVLFRSMKSSNMRKATIDNAKNLAKSRGVILREYDGVEVIDITTSTSGESKSVVASVITKVNTVFPKSTAKVATELWQQIWQ